MNIDRTQKENIVYIKEGTIAKASSLSSEITLEDMYDFVKDEINLAQYNQINEGLEELEFDEEGFPTSFPTNTETVKEIGLLGQDLVYTENPIVDYIVDAEKAFKQNIALECNESNYINVLAGALKLAINKIETLEKEIENLRR